MKIIWILVWLACGNYDNSDRTDYRTSGQCNKYQNERWQVFDSSSSLVNYIKSESISLKSSRVFSANEYSLSVVPMEIILK